MNKGPLAKIAWILLIIGGLNWGLVGVGGLAGSNWNIINQILGGVQTLELVVYILVGISALIVLFGGKRS